MVRRGRKFYTEDFKAQVLAAYNNSDESVTETASRFQINRDTVKSWVYRKRTASTLFSAGSVNFAASKTRQMSKKTKLSPEEMSARIEQLEQQLSVDKMRSESPGKMI
jgi:transposase-like protein